MITRMFGIRVQRKNEGILKYELRMGRNCLSTDEKVQQLMNSKYCIDYQKEPCTLSIHMLSLNNRNTVQIKRKRKKFTLKSLSHLANPFGTPPSYYPYHILEDSTYLYNNTSHSYYHMRDDLPILKGMISKCKHYAKVDQTKHLHRMYN